MKVKELTEVLDKLNPDADVIMVSDDVRLDGDVLITWKCGDGCRKSDCKEVYIENNPNVEN